MRDCGVSGPNEPSAQSIDFHLIKRRRDSREIGLHTGTRTAERIQHVTMGSKNDPEEVSNSRNLPSYNYI
jgi:hypothetical protein